MNSKIKEKIVCTIFNRLIKMNVNYLNRLYELENVSLCRIELTVYTRKCNVYF